MKEASRDVSLPEAGKRRAENPRGGPGRWQEGGAAACCLSLPSLCDRGLQPRCPSPGHRAKTNGKSLAWDVAPGKCLHKRLLRRRPISTC